MVKNNNVTQICRRINDLILQLKDINNQLNCSISNGKRDYLLRFRLQIRNKLQSNLGQFKNLLEYNEVTITYKVDNDVKEYKFYNVSSEDASFILKNYAQLKGQEIDILEIKELTFSCPEKL